MEFDHLVLDNIPASKEGLRGLLNEYGKQGYRYQGMILDSIVMVREAQPKALESVKTESKKAKQP